MKRRISLILMLLLCISAYSQNAGEVKGSIIDAVTKDPLAGVSVMLQGHNQSSTTDREGKFVFRNVPSGDNVLVISSPTIVTIQLPVSIARTNNLDLGSFEVNTEKRGNALVDLYQDDNLDNFMADDDSDYSSQNINALVLVANDPYLDITSYQFSSVRFRTRGYLNKYGQTYLSGVEFNDQVRGVFNYSMIGAMNDMTRNGDVINFTQPGSFSFGNIGGSQNINLRASGYAKGKKLTLSYTNRNYYLRGMASYSTGLMDNGWAFSGLVGFRYSDEGAVEGTFYNNLSYFFALEKQWDGGKHSFSFTTFGSPVQRGQQSGNTREVFELVDDYQYNSYWGYQNGDKRNSRIVTAYDPTAIFSYIIKFNRNTTLTNGLGIHYSRYGSTALNFFKNAADPKPDYYRYMPSYRVPSDELTPGSEEHGVSWAAYQSYRDAWTSGRKAQLNWDMMYEANELDKEEAKRLESLNRPDLAAIQRSARFMVEERRNDLLEASFNSSLESKINDYVTLNAGVGFRKTKSFTFTTVNDLLGAEYLIDTDKFGERDFGSTSDVIQNDLNNPNRKTYEGDRFGYDYNIHVNSANAWFHNQHKYNNFDLYYGAKLTYTEYQREGNMRNGRNPLNSYGKGQHHTFVDQAIKAGFVYKLDGRNYFVGNIGYQTQAPLPYDAYVSPRVSDKAVNDLQSERILSADFGYVFSYPRINGRVTVFQTNFYDLTQKSSYYSDIYATYIHHMLSDVNKIHRGVELGLSVKATNDLTLSFGGTVGEYYYSNRPEGTISWENNKEPDTSETVYIKDYYVGGTPQVAGTLGANYFWKYWFFGANLNGFARSYLDPSPIQRTESAIATIPTDYEQAYNETLNNLLDQQKLKGGLTLDLSVGKLLFLRGGRSMSFNLSVNNVLNYRKLQTGGYEQGRFDVTNMDKFAPKYYYMQGINCYFNVNYKF